MYKKRTRVRIALGLFGAAAVVVCLGLWFVARSYRPSAVKGRIEAFLSDQLESEVTIASLEGDFFPRVALSGGGLVVRHRGRTDVPPLLTIEHFEIRASLRELMQKPRHVSDVRLRGLQVHIAPSDDEDDNVSVDLSDFSVSSYEPSV